MANRVVSLYLYVRVSFFKGLYRKSQYLKRILILILGCSSPKAFSIDLLEVYQLALRNDPVFEVARYRLKAELEKSPQAMAGFLPNVNVSGATNVARSKSQFTNINPEDRKVNSWNWSLQVSQPILHLENKYAYDEARASVKQARAQFVLAQQDMILRIAEAYFGVLSAREEIIVFESELVAAEEQLSLVKKGLDQGISAMSDVLEGQSGVDLALSQLLAARNEFEIKSAELSKIVDVFPEDLAELSASAVIPPPEPDNVQYWISNARQNNPAVQVAKFGLKVGDAAVGKARSEHAPTVDLIASYGTTYSSGSTTTPNDFASKSLDWRVGVQFNMPLYSGGMTSSRVSEAIANKYRAGAELEVAVRQASTDARTAYAGVKNGLAQIKALETAVKSGINVVSESQAGYRLGVYNNFKVLDAVRKLYGAKRDYVKARYETVFQALKLKASNGVLTEQDLININGLLVSNEYKVQS